MRIRDLRIEDFRGLRLLRMRDLGRINLIVGANDSGKTAVLEAISILMSGGDASAIWSILYRRGETAWAEGEAKRAGSLRFEIDRLFHGREIGDRSSFRISADTDRGEAAVTAKIERFRPASQASRPPHEGAAVEARAPLMLKIAWSHGPSREAAFPLDDRGGVAASTILRTARGDRDGPPVRFLGPAPPNKEQLAALLAKVVGAPEQELATEWLKAIEPAIEGIASRRPGAEESTAPGSSGEGPLVRLRGVEGWLPIGSLGAGIGRMLALALNMVHASNGTLLVDEIDAGIHHSAMEGLWRRVASAAERYNVQVFATTHGRDCCEGLASVCRPGHLGAGDVTIQRVEPGREEVVASAEDAIIAAAGRGIEVR